MVERILYLVSVVAVGWAVTCALRALPFLLFAGRDRELPPWVERFGRIVSPVIIGGLVVYSYSELEWRTAWPYLAGALTVGLQCWRRNPLLSIVAGTVLYMALLATGCTTAQPLEFAADNPAVRITSHGVMFAGERVVAEEVPELLEEYGAPHSRTIHILLDPDVRDLMPARMLMARLARAGYTRSVLVTKRHAEAVNLGKRKPSAASAKSVRPEPKRQIRYKRASE